jgi:hypothetical protein
LITVKHSNILIKPLRAPITVTSTSRDGGRRGGVLRNSSQILILIIGPSQSYATQGQRRRGRRGKSAEAFLQLIHGKKFASNFYDVDVDVGVGLLLLLLLLRVRVTYLT